MFNLNIDTFEVHFRMTKEDIKKIKETKEKERKDRAKKPKWYYDNGCLIKRTDVARYSIYIKNRYLIIKPWITKLQNGNNVKKYSFKKSFDLIDVINRDICETMQSGYFILQNGQQTRIDINSDYVFNNEDDADEFIRFLNSLNLTGRELKEEYKTGFVKQSKKKKKTEFRVYRKDLDIHVEQEILNHMKPTVRVEFQIEKAKKIRKIFGTDRPDFLLLNPEFSCCAWNKLVQQYRLDAAIYDKKQFFKVAQKILNVGKKTFHRYKKIFTKSWGNEALTRNEKETLRKNSLELYRCGVTPAYCRISVPFVMQVSRRQYRKLTRKFFEKIREAKEVIIKRNNVVKLCLTNFEYIKFIWLDSS